MSAERLLSALAFVAPAVFEACGLRPDCCVAATRAGLEVLAAWKVKGRALLCEAQACNAVWLTGDRTPGRAWAVGIDADSKGPGLPGHLVIVGKTGGEHFLLDLSARQMHRPHKGIFIERGLCVRTDGPLMGDWSLGVPLPEGGRLAYRPHLAPHAARYQTAGDWRLPTSGHRRGHATTVHTLRTETEKLVRRGTQEETQT